MAAEHQKLARSNSISQASENSQTAQEFINSQLQLEADAREALPYQFDTCTRPLGALRQSLFSCLTCNPPPKDSNAPYQAAGVCYSCSISCHGEHELVELFNKRNFVCDCGTTRLPSTSPCSLRINHESGIKGNVHSERPAAENKYNQNFRNRFCTCGEVYDAHTEQGTMFQCIGLGTVETGGCGEDWYHPECIMGLSRDWRKSIKKHSEIPEAAIASVVVENNQSSIPPTSTDDVPNQDEIPKQEEPVAQTGAPVMDTPATENAVPNTEAVIQEEDDSMPPGFPNEDDFEDFLCYKCVDANPWIKKYANSTGFLAAMPHQDQKIAGADLITVQVTLQKKRKASPDAEEDGVSQPAKKHRGSEEPFGLPVIDEASSSTIANNEVKPPCLYEVLPPALEGSVSLFTKEDFRTNFCRCPKCYPSLAKFTCLLEEEDTYEPPISEEGDDEAPGSLGSRSLLDRGEAALSNMDRVRAIEGVMVYNHLKDKVKSFLKPFAESGQAVGAEDIKKYFEGLRGDADAISAAAKKSNGASKNDKDDDGRKEQSGY